MKTQRVKGMLSLLFLLSGWVIGFGQEIEVPGDHFSLEGALELFKKSESPEQFEKLLNSSESKVNNLDLNGDGYIDYVRVIDRNEGNVHAFIIQAIVSENESQDVAVIELEKLANGKAILQITGDEDIYGIETIIEPTREVRVNAGTSTQRTVVNVWAWPAVQYVYSPYYSSWISPWGWSMRPIWWRTWRPVAYYEYNPWWQPYRPYYSVCYTHRVVYAQHIYQPYRTTSVVVHNRHNNQIAHYRSTRDHNDRNGRGWEDNGRTRSDQNREVGRNDRSGVSNSEIRSSALRPLNSKSAANHTNQIQRKEDVTRRPSTVRDDYSSINRGRSDVQRVPSSPKRNPSVQSKEYSPVKRPSDNDRSVIRQGTRPSVSNNSGARPQVQRPSGSSNKQVSRQPAVRPTTPIERRSPAPKPNVQRSGNGNGSKTIVKKKRGGN